VGDAGWLAQPERQSDNTKKTDTMSFMVCTCRTGLIFRQL
jgi:hypothetical protein